MGKFRKTLSALGMAWGIRKVADRERQKLAEETADALYRKQKGLPSKQQQKRESLVGLIVLGGLLFVAAGLGVFAWLHHRGLV